MHIAQMQYARPLRNFSLRSICQYECPFHPAPGKVTRIVRKPPKPARINIRMGAETLEGLKLRAAEAGLPYQTLAASELHMVATSKLKLDFVKG